MSDALLSSQDRQEALSRAYACAIAAAAGYSSYVPDVDRDSVDIGFNAGGDMRPNLHVQLKATISLRRSGDLFKLSIKKKNYDDLRVPTVVPRVIVVLAMPGSETKWLNVSVKQLVMKRCAYWASLKGLPELSEGQQSVTISVPEGNRFDVDGLRKLMEMARRGSVP
jgi:Domain of unknown function (DUF4365)